MTKVLVTKCRKCGALDSIDERVGGQAFIHTQQGVYKSKDDGKLYLSQWDFSEPEPTPEDFDSQFTDSYYCRECDAYELGLSTQKELSEKLYTVEEIEEEELKKLRADRKAKILKEETK